MARGHANSLPNPQAHRGPWIRGFTELPMSNVNLCKNTSKPSRHNPITPSLNVDSSLQSMLLRNCQTLEQPQNLPHTVNSPG